ncbi:MAG: PKD domain-containing protein [Deltaproteobacteria bacterium]|nr:PKD domain-containing protein [Deltaproteobacteria bacterium]
MRASRAAFLALLMLSGCGGCNKDKATPTGDAASKAPAPQQAPAANVNQAPPQAAQPQAAEQNQANDEDDCIVIADANPDYGPPPLNVAFSAEAECTRGEPTYKWDFGDGTSSTEANPSHTYAKVGDFTASVAVTAGTANATDEIDITVEADAEPEAP